MFSFRMKPGQTTAAGAGLVQRCRLGVKQLAFSSRHQGADDLELATIGWVLSCVKSPPHQTPFKIWLFRVILLIETMTFSTYRFLKI